ncbi:MAG: HEAT repeat domain-containing protein [Planctomycetota bacterium]
MRSLLLVPLLCAVVLPSNAAKEAARKLNELQTRYRGVAEDHRLISDRREARYEILRDALRLQTRSASDWAIARMRDSGDEDLQRRILRFLAKEQRENPRVVRLFRELMTSDRSQRRLARDFLIQWAVRESEHAWLERLFRQGSVEERFLAVRALGRIAGPTTVEMARELMDDPEWEAEKDGVMQCATLATAMQSFEGEAAARLLLLLKRDRRCTARDREAIQHATRGWKHADLSRYVSLMALSDPDPLRRQNVADFMGRAGVESARAPLWSLARSRREPSAVRAAAAGSLGYLKLSRGALARDLGTLLRDEDKAVAEAAVRALARLRVKVAVEILVEVLDGPLGALARGELGRNLSLPAGTDWARWVVSEECKLPRGT